MWKVVEAADESLREVRSHYQENIKSVYYFIFIISSISGEEGGVSAEMGENQEGEGGSGN